MYTECADLQRPDNAGAQHVELLPQPALVALQAYRQELLVHSLQTLFVPAEFMELMEFRYQEKARAKGCYIVSAAGFDSIPADLGVLFTQRQFPAPATPSSVTSFLSIHVGPAGACGGLLS